MKRPGAIKKSVTFRRKSIMPVRVAGEADDEDAQEEGVETDEIVDDENAEPEAGETEEQAEDEDAEEEDEDEILDLGDDLDEEAFEESYNRARFSDVEEFDADALFGSFSKEEPFRCVRDEYEEICPARMARDGTALQGAAKRSASEPRRKLCPMNVGTYTYEEPLREKALVPGFNCIVAVLIGTVVFRCCIDTGSARSLARTAFLEQLMKSQKTKGCVKDRYRIAGYLACSGVCDDMRSPQVTKQSVLQVKFQPIDPQGHAPPRAPSLDVEVIELDNAADVLLIGFPDIVRWGIRFFKDADDNIWVDFTNLGFMTLAEGPKKNGQ